MRRRHEKLAFAGSIHFITTVTRDRGTWFTSESDCTLILSKFEKYRSRFGVECLGYVLMPDHIHALLRQVEDGSAVSDLMASFKRETSKVLTTPRIRGFTLWRDRYDDVPIPGLDAGLTRLKYLHENPVRRGIVEKATDYRWSSARFYFELDNDNSISLTRP